MKSSKVPLTNEEIKKNFKNQFDLVNYAIKRAEYYVYKGQGAALGEHENPALQVMDELARGEELVLEEEVDAEEVAPLTIEDESPSAESLAEVSS